MEDMRARVKAARKKKHKATTVSDNVKRVAAFITWLVLHSLTEVLTPNSDHEHRVKIGSTSYWFNWSKLPLLGDHLCVFLASKWRKLPNGDLIPESYTTLAKFRASVASTFSMPKVNIINAWRMWHGGSKRCGENGHEKVRPFKNIPEDDLLVISKKVRKSWRVWKCVMDHLCDKLDDLKAKGIYDWKGSDGNKSPLTPDTIMYLARVIPAAPQKPGKSKRTVVASMNTVGTVRKNMSRANKV